MPELPEVETVCGGMRQTILDDPIADICQRRADLRIPFPATLQDDLNGQTITHIRRRSKYILADLTNGKTLVIHLGMSGRILITEAGQSYTPQKHDHFIVDFRSGRKLVYTDPRRFGMIFTEDTDALDDHKTFRHLGPEPLSNHFDTDYFHQQLRKRKTPVKTALLDQKLVVGIGNIYACEALYFAGIHPARPCNSLSRDESDALYRAIRHVLRIAIEAGGSTLKDYKHADGQMGYFQFQFAVYDQEGKPCKNCDCGQTSKEDRVQKIVQSGRSTYFCATKQV